MLTVTVSIDSNEIMNIKHVALCLVITKAEKMETIHDLNKLSTYYL